MNFIAIDPRTTSVEVVEAEGPTDVFERVGLKTSEVDHGTLYKYETGELICIIVYEAGLFKGDAGRYFSIGTHLYEGGAVIYGADERGETISISHKPPVVFYRDIAGVERAIASGEVLRPQRGFGGTITWKWPEVRDFHLNEQETELMIKMVKDDKTGD